MKNYYWKGMNLDGHNKGGKTFANNPKELRETLLNQGIALLSFKIKDNVFNSKLFLLFSKKISNKHKAFFFEQLAILVINGLTLLDSLNLIVTQIKNKRLNEIVFEMIDNIKNGGSLFSSLRKYETVFSETEISIIAAGENAGKLGFALTRISTNLNRQIELRKKIQNAAMLPLVTLFFALFLVWGIFILVLPQFETLFSSFDKELPDITRRILAISRFLRSESVFPVFIFFIFSLLIFKLIFRFKFVKKVKDWIILKVYFVKDIFIYYEIMNFFQTLSMFLASGVDLKKSLDLSKNTINNFFIKQQFSKSIDFVVKGDSFQLALQKSCHEILPENILAFISVGEKTGKLSEMLQRSVDLCQNILEQKLNNCVTFLQPVLLIIVGIIVVALMLSIYLPIFSMAGLT